MKAHQRKIVEEIMERWQGKVAEGQTLIHAILDIGRLQGIIIDLENDAPMPGAPGIVVAAHAERIRSPKQIEPTPAARIKTDPSKPCRRGEREHDDSGVPFKHNYQKELGYCIFCNDGLPPPPATPDPGSNLLENGGEEKVWCDIHGWHHIKVRPDGTMIDPPKDCPIFSAQEQV